MLSFTLLKGAQLIAQGKITSTFGGELKVKQQHPTAGWLNTGTRSVHCVTDGTTRPLLHHGVWHPWVPCKKIDEFSSGLLHPPANAIAHV